MVDKQDTLQLETVQPTYLTFTQLSPEFPTRRLPVLIPHRGTRRRRAARLVKPAAGSRAATTSKEVYDFL